MTRKRYPSLLAGLLALSCTDGGPGGQGPLDLATQDPDPDLASPPDLLPPSDLQGTVLATATGFDVPESAYFHAGSDSFYVSNMSLTDFSKLTVKDSKGWISKLDRDGKVVQLKWLEASLSSPAGMRAVGSTLYIANIDELVAVDVQTKAVQRVAFPGAQLLNDVDIAKDGTIYVTDTFGNSIWSYKPGAQPQKLLSDPMLKQPNGILVAGTRLLIASTGPFDKPLELGGLFSLNLETKALLSLGVFGKFDGIEADGEALLLSDNPSALVYSYQAGAAPLLLRDAKAQDKLKSIGDIGFDPARRLLSVPDLQSNTVTFLKIP